MQYSFSIITPNDTSMAERLLRIIRVRGFAIEKMAAEKTDTSMNYQFTVTSDRSINSLTRQLEKVIGVRLYPADSFQNGAVICVPADKQL
jgi:acetolactate synthase II small subunit